MGENGLNQRLAQEPGIQQPTQPKPADNGKPGNNEPRRPSMWERIGKPAVATVIVVAFIVVALKFIRNTEPENNQAETAEATEQPAVVKDEPAVTTDNKDNSVAIAGNSDDPKTQPKKKTEPATEAKPDFMSDLKKCEDLTAALDVLQKYSVTNKGTETECLDTKSSYWIIDRKTDMRIVAVLTPEKDGSRINILNNRKESLDNYNSEAYNFMWFTK